MLGLASTMLVVALSTAAYAQSRSHSNWIFGRRCAISWDEDGELTTGTNPVIDTAEGVATYSDPVTGELILYTDGMTAWNASHSVVSSGHLGGHRSAAQSGIIIPVPGTADHYYIFTQPRLRGAVRYSWFDMSGAGSQVGGPTAVPDTGDSGETLGAVPHRNGRDFWVLTSANSGARNVVLVMLVTPDGVSEPDIYEQEDPGIAGGLGQFVFTSDSSRVALAGGAISIWDFNTATGALTDRVAIETPVPSTSVTGGGLSSYGAAFSPDDTKLYIQLYRPAPAVFQIDLIDDMAVTELGNCNGPYGGQLSLAVDGRIYAGSYNSGGAQPYVGVIASPNEAGVAADFTTRGVTMPGGCIVHYGLPTALSAFAELIRDSDDDGVADSEDADSDNDGIPDVVELGGEDLSVDSNRNGVADYEDAFLIDCVDDDPADGFCDSLLPEYDADGDGVPNHLDLDSDNDGIPDIVENGSMDLDEDGDGRADDETDVDEDGLLAVFDTEDEDPDVITSAAGLVSTDDDGYPDYLDLDADGDGASDLIEGGGSDADGDGLVDDTTDDDGDGLAAVVDSDEGGTPLSLPDSDVDGDFDFQDLCADGRVAGDEECDDGGIEAGDGCSATCTVEDGFDCEGDPSACDEICGDGLIVGDEGCDDGNTDAGDGCSDACTVEDGWACDDEPSLCDEVCGDGLIVGDEGCDDGNTEAADGCSEDRKIDDE